MSIFRTIKQEYDNSKNKEKFLIAGTGSNGTHDTIAVTKEVADIGYHAALV